MMPACSEAHILKDPHCLNGFWLSVPIGQVRDVAHQDLTTTSVVITWANVICRERGGTLLHYHLTVRDTAKDEEVYEADTAEMTATLNGLLPYAKYGVEVAYVNREGSGPTSDEYAVTTLQSSK